MHQLLQVGVNCKKIHCHIGSLHFHETLAMALYLFRLSNNPASLDLYRKFFWPTYYAVADMWQDLIQLELRLVRFRVELWGMGYQAFG